MSGSWTNAGNPTSGTSASIPGLTPGTEYDLEVVATNAIGSATSAPITATTVSGVQPSTPTGLAVSGITAISLTLSWTAPVTGTPPVTYLPQFRVTGQTAWTSFGSPISATSVVITGLSSATPYDLQVVATNPVGSTPSGPISTATASTGNAPAPATGLTFVASTTNSVTFSWMASASGTQPITYQAQYRAVGAAAWVFSGIPSSALTATVIGLAPGTAYEVSVAASNVIGSTQSAPLSVSTVAIGVPPSAPTLSISAVTPTAATLTWTASATGTQPINYQPQFRIAGSASWINFGTQTSALTATVSGLSAGGTYDFQVVASNAAGTATTTTQTAATTAATLPPSAPGTPTAWIITPTSVSLTWTASTFGTAPVAYVIQYRIHGAAAWANAGSPTSATAGTASGLTPGADYDFQILAANAAGTSASGFITILAPFSGNTMTVASFVPNEVLTAEALDAALNSKLDATGGAVGPLTINQPAAGGNNSAALALTRPSGGLGDSALISGSYTALMVDGPVVPYSSIAMTLAVVGDGTGNGPAGNVMNIFGSLAISCLRSTAATGSGSQHSAVVAQVAKTAPAGGVPSGRRMADGTGFSGSVVDSTGLASLSAGGATFLSGSVQANNRDDADLRYGMSITYGEASAVSTGGAPAEFARGLSVVATSTTAYAKVIVEVGGGYSTAGIDMRAALGSVGTITSATPGAPVSAITVSNALAFASAGSPAAAVNASNPKAVTINGHAYSVVAVNLAPGGTTGVLTFASPVAAADAAQGLTVTPVSVHGIWLSEGGNGALPGDIAFNRAGTARMFYDPTGGGLTATTGADRFTIAGTSSARLPAGTSLQRPSSGLLGDIRANADNNTYEVYQPASNAWVPLATTAVSGGVGAGPATALIAGTPTTSAVSLSWSAPSVGTPPFSYQVQYRVSGTASWTNWGAAQTATSTTISSLTSGTRYDFQVVTSNTYGSSVSPTASVTIGATAPGAPSGLVLSNATSTTIVLTWTPSQTGTQPISYQVQYSPAGAGSWSSGPATAGSSATITSLTPATSFDFRVVALNSGGSATSPTATASTTAAATASPSAPTAVSAGSPTSSTILVGWTAPASGTAPFSYQVAYRVTGTSPWTNFGSPVTSTSQTVTGLVAQTSYDFQVTAVNSAGSSTSSPVTAITSATPVAGAGSVAGSQTSGTAAPVITGPATGSVIVNNVLGMPGISISDQAAAVAAGSCTIFLTCTSGTVTTTVGGSQVAGSGGKSITYSNTLAACQAAAADLYYTASATAGSDNVVVRFTDQAGNSSSISIAIAVSVDSSGGTPAGTIPTDATGRQAVNAQNVLNGFGVNTHIDYAGYQTAGLPLIENCINYLGGIKVLRDVTASSSDSTWWTQVAQATNTRFIAGIGLTDSANYQQQLNNAGAVPGSYILAFEGCEEADTGQAVGYAETLQTAAAFQPTVYHAGQTYGLPTIQMSFGQGWNTNPSQGNYGAVGNLSAYADYGNAHIGFSQSPLTNSLTTNFISLAQLATPGKPAAVTAFGWNQAVGSGYGSCSPATAAAYVLMAIFDMYAAGCPWYIWNGLIDDVASEGSSSKGLFTDTGTPRPSATAVRNLFSLLSDGASNATSFGTGKLNYTLTNLPANSGQNGGYQMLLQKSDGTFWLALWNEQPLNDASTGADLTVAPVNVTLSLGTTPTSITVYDPSVSANPVQSAGAVSSLTISLPARVILVKIVHV